MGGSACELDVGNTEVRKKVMFWFSNCVKPIGRTDCGEKTKVALWTEPGIFIRHVERSWFSWVISGL